MPVAKYRISARGPDVPLFLYLAGPIKGTRYANQMDFQAGGIITVCHAGAGIDGPESGQGGTP